MTSPVSNLFFPFLLCPLPGCHKAEERLQLYRVPSVTVQMPVINFTGRRQFQRSGDVPIMVRALLWCQASEKTHQVKDGFFSTFEKRYNLKKKTNLVYTLYIMLFPCENGKTVQAANVRRL